MSTIKTAGPHQQLCNTRGDTGGWDTDVGSYQHMRVAVVSIRIIIIIIIVIVVNVVVLV